MNRRQRRAMDRMTEKQFMKIRNEMLKKLKQQYPNKTLEEIINQNVQLQEETTRDNNTNS